ncbi:sensor histidine kinase [Catenuloplanes atrovinosus]|uniref:Oxygen sensor histidine kinase NreB n=1 Tax=Catenuloplanes atrovinosus TaxID=137266 RepID=A0AAE3YQC5_9ACTN|nr:sensor histidine kinase [Catenuloplanes atrovinosus]MDR7276468.1 signal transduction histidine kinase [Catenuloplanes atrovinosus]
MTDRDAHPPAPATELIDGRLARALALLPLALTAAATALAVAVAPDRPYPLLMPLVVATAAWGHLGWRWVARRPRGDHAVVLHLAVLWALHAALIRMDPVFVIAAIGGLVAAPMLTLDWRGFPGVFAFSVLVNVVPGPPEGATAWAITAAVVAVQTVLLGGSGTVSRWIQEQSEQRRRAVAALEAAAAENARLHRRLVEQAREAGAVAERARVAREIHDTLAQGLAGVLTQLDAARCAGSVPEPAGGHLDRAAGLARSTLDDARRSLHALRPAPLSGGLIAALRDTVDEWTGDTGVDADLRADPPPAGLSRAGEVVLLRALREALANAARHAGASKVVVTLTAMDDAVALDVRDDGRGFAPDGARPGSFGLTGIRERAEAVGGRMEIESAPGAGTVLSVLLPAGTDAT